MATAADLLMVIAPKFGDTTPSVRASMLDLAEELIGAEHPKRELSVAYMAAHMLETAARSGSSGAIQSEKEGDLQRSYAVAVTSSNDSLDSTSYGLALKHIRRSFYFAARTRVV
jgi:hypothetical protein